MPIYAMSLKYVTTKFCKIMLCRNKLILKILKQFQYLHKGTKFIKKGTELEKKATTLTMAQGRGIVAPLGPCPPPCGRPCQ